MRDATTSLEFLFVVIDVVESRIEFRPRDLRSKISFSLLAMPPQTNPPAYQGTHARNSCYYAQCDRDTQGSGADVGGAGGNCVRGRDRMRQ
jgi:hypothetical protein